MGSDTVKQTLPPLPPGATLDNALPPLPPGAVLDTGPSRPARFDPEGDGYDYDTALAAGMGPDASGHWSSREPRTGQLLKGRGHETFYKTIAGEKAAGYEVYKGKDGKYYSRETPTKLDNALPPLPPGAVLDTGPSRPASAQPTPAKKPVTTMENIKDNFFMNILSHLPFSPIADYEKRTHALFKKQLKTGNIRNQAQYGMTPMGGFTMTRPAQTRAPLEKVVKDYEEKQARGMTTAAEIFSAIGDLPAYATEFVVAGGPVTGGLKTGVPKLIGAAAKRSIFRTMLQPSRVEAAFVDQAQKGEGAFTSSVKSYADVFIENLSEEAGAAFLPILQKLPFGKRLIETMVRIGKKLKVPKKEVLQRLSTKAGWHGLAGEWGEERISTELKAMLGVHDFGAGEDASFVGRMAAGLRQDMTLHNQVVELFTLSAFPVARGAMSILLGPDAPVQDTDLPPTVAETMEAKKAGPQTKVPGIADESAPPVDRRGMEEAVTVQQESPGRTVRAEEQQPATMMADAKRQLVQEYMATGMDEERATEYAERTLQGEEMTQPTGGGDVIYQELPVNKLETTPGVTAPTEGTNRQALDESIVRATAAQYQVSTEEAEKIVSQSRTAGEQPSEARVLAAFLGTKSKEVGTPTERLNRSGVRKAAYQAQQVAEGSTLAFSRLERWLGALDGNVDDGPIRTAIWGRLKKSSQIRKQNVHEAAATFKKTMADMGVDINAWMSKTEDIVPGTRLTKGQQLGVAMLAQNEHGARYLERGMKIHPEVIAYIERRVSADTEMQPVMRWMQRQYSQQWARIHDAAVAAGINPKLLQQEKDYFPLMRLDNTSVQSPTDILSLLTNQFEGKATPEAGMLKQRQRGAAGEIELDAFTVMLNNLAKAESFIAMAPTASEIAKITNNSEFRRALNRATYGKGVTILDRFIRHTVRDSSGDPIRGWEKVVRSLRLNVKQYLIAGKVLSGMRATLSTFNAWEAHPQVASMWAKHMLSLKGGLDWGKYRELRSRAEEKSTYVKYRAWDKDFKRRFTGEDAKTYLLGKQRIDKKLLGLVTYADKVTVVMNWNALYDHALLNEGMSETQAVEYADMWLGRSQPMGDPEHLPDFFRSGEVAKAFADFQQMPNQQWNALVYDILGARKAGQISRTMATYRIFTAFILPAITLGIVARGRWPEDWGEFLSDLILYPLSSLPIVGPIAMQTAKGWSSGNFLAGMPLAEVEKLGRELRGRKTQGRKDRLGTVVGGGRKRDLAQIAKRATTTFGSATGKIPHQAVITAEGAYDLYTGKSDDPRRLLWSAYQLGEKNKPKQKRVSRKAD